MSVVPLVKHIRPDSNGSIEFLDNWHRNSGVGVLRGTATSASAVAQIQISCPPLPANARVLYYVIQNQSASTIATGTAVGIGTGTSGDPDKYAEITENNIDAVGEYAIGLPDTTAFTTASEVLYLTPTNGSGTAAGTLLGSWDVAIYFEQVAIFESA